MKIRRATQIVRCLLYTVVLFFPLAVLAGDFEVSLNDLTTETQRMSEDPERIGLVWWLPVEFWEVSMASGSAPSTPEQISAFTSALRAYAIFAVADGIVGQFGGVTWIPKETVRESVMLQDAAGTRYAPLKEEQVSADVRNLAAMLKPVFAGMLGPMGQNMEFYFFPSASVEGRPIAEARAEGSFRFQVGADLYDWRLPLGSLLPKKVCPVDRQHLSGAWKYCPWHGKTLQAQPK
jgi:hypothetical protein